MKGGIELLSKGDKLHPKFVVVSSTALFIRSLYLLELAGGARVGV